MPSLTGCYSDNSSCRRAIAELHRRFGAKTSAAVQSTPKFFFTGTLLTGSVLQSSHVARVGPACSYVHFNRDPNASTSGGADAIRRNKNLEMRRCHEYAQYMTRGVAPG
eukprot:102125-Chlamydomonas_euryale.AAC.1